MTELTAETAKKDDLTRVIVLLYGMLQSGSPFWCYVAVKPSKYQPFMAAQKEGKINLYDFNEWGEIIVSGEGRTPPDEITLKVAEMYQTDPATLFQVADVEKEVERVTETEKKKLKKD
jgi:hypothetical protein